VSSTGAQVMEERCGVQTAATYMLRDCNIDFNSCLIVLHLFRMENAAEQCF
jgi:hypothetical protein